MVRDVASWYLRGTATAVIRYPRRIRARETATTPTEGTHTMTAIMSFVLMAYTPRVHRGHTGAQSRAFIVLASHDLALRYTSP